MSRTRLVVKLENEIKDIKLNREELIDTLIMSENNRDFYRDLWIAGERKFHMLRSNYLEPLREEVGELKKNLQKLSQENLRMTGEKTMTSEAFMEAFEQMFLKYPDNTLIFDFYERFRVELNKIKEAHRLSIDTLDGAGDSIKMIRNQKDEKKIQQSKDLLLPIKNESSTEEKSEKIEEVIEVEGPKIYGLKSTLENSLKQQTDDVTDIEDFGLPPEKVEQLLKACKIDDLNETDKKLNDQSEPIEYGLVKIHELKSKPPPKPPRKSISCHKIVVKAEIHPEPKIDPELVPSNCKIDLIEKLDEPSQNLPDEQTREVNKEATEVKTLSQRKRFKFGFGGLFKLCYGKK